MFKIFSLSPFFTLLFISLNLLNYTYAACDSGTIEEADDCCTDKYIDSTGHFDINPNVTAIGDYAFSNSTTYIGCDKLKSITITNNVKSIGNSAFYYCDKLENVTMGRNVQSIGERAFLSCDTLNNINLADSIYSIGQYAFTRTGLKSIILPYNLTEIKEYTFVGCDKLETVIMGNNVQSIGNFAFQGCSALTYITLSKSIISIGKAAFAHSGLTNITLPNSITSIGQFVFAETKNLTNVFIGNNITSLFFNTFGQFNTNNYRLDITLETISVIDNITISFISNGFYDNAILENNLIVEKRSETGLTKTYNCTKGYNISAAIEYTEQNCLKIEEPPTLQPTVAPTLQPTSQPTKPNNYQLSTLEIILIVITSLLFLICIFLILFIFKNNFVNCFPTFFGFNNL